ncbi:MAG TPA: hypothetical protein VGG72_09210 [Bryobacteraceae bacterium]|jgi:hypothetical protein
MPELGYYPYLRFPVWFSAPSGFSRVIEDLWNRHYPGLYEDPAGRPPSNLDEAFQALLGLLWTEGSNVGHQRCLWAGWAAGKACQATIEGWRAGDPRPQLVQAAVQTFLEYGRIPSTGWRATFPQLVSPPQALHEALDVFWNLARMLDPLEARPAFIEILEDSIEGYGIVPGSQGKRDIFNWFLVEVMPAAWSLRLPDRIYSLKWPWPPPDEHATKT